MRVAAALAELASERVEILARGESLTIEVEGAEVTITHTDVEVQREARANVAFAATPTGLTVGLDTTLTPELESEGLAREFAHRVQNARKSADYVVTDRIRIRYAATARLAAALAAKADVVREETLAVSLDALPPDATQGEVWSFDGEEVRVAIDKAAEPAKETT